ncbi:polysaccharide deacetylase family protein [Nocardioides panacisoli]|uniref:Polysaccharide deacetylase family protein n=1 Tax=Nocardioides panacisoli TaxID=627624 RepID=A0ABP7IQE6_9ACTN
MRRPSALVLMYHGVDRVGAVRDPHAMFVTPEAFRAQVEHVLESGFVPITVQDYLAGLDGVPLPQKAVLITFDDGYLGVGEHAAPVLASFGVPSVLYVPAGLLGGWSEWLEPRHRHRLMSDADLRAVHGQGMAVGVHGLDHTDLTTLSDAELRRQTVDTREVLESVVGDDVRSFAFPYGSHDARVRAAVRAAGYRAAFAVHDREDDFAIRRVDVNAFDTMRTFRLKLRPLYPSVRSASERFPAARRLAHDLLGRAVRDQHDGGTVTVRTR